MVFEAGEAEAPEFAGAGVAVVVFDGAVEVDFCYGWGEDGGAGAKADVEELDGRERGLGRLDSVDFFDCLWVNVLSVRVRQRGFVVGWFGGGAYSFELPHAPYYVHHSGLWPNLGLGT